MAAPAPSPPPPTRARASGLVGTADAITESVRGSLCGLLFGITSPLVAAPIDALKTQMQAGSAAYQRGGAFTTLAAIVRSEGVRALYRGLLPPLVGSTIFRSVQFTVYGGVYSGLRDSPAATTPVPGTAGMQPRVLLAGLAASFVRSCVESPLEFVKVRRQTGQRVTLAPTLGEAMRSPVAELGNLFKGFGVCWGRTSGVLTSFFVQVDHLERHHAELVATPLIGPFLKGGVCATTGWLLFWPLEVVKNQVQASTPMAGVQPGAGTLQRLRAIVGERGIVGLYRGVGPGVARSLLANGSSMVVYTACQERMRS